MPSFYGRQPTGLPLTPPDFSNFGPMGQTFFAGNHLPTMSYGQSKGSQEMFDMLNQQQQQMGWAMNHNQVGVPHMQAGHRQQLHRAASFVVQPPPGLVHPSHTRFQSMDAGKPICLPPMKQMSTEQMFEEALQLSNSSLKATEQGKSAVKVEEKPVGGVSAFLDYEMDDMADFVASVATGIVLNGSTQAQSSPAFRKFVFQILSSTRLPSSTILLGLDYLSTRMNMRTMNTEKNNQLYKVLTIALLLASKFLDDNTFQNRSWAEVTGLPVLELNTLEADWLAAIGWNLHVDPAANKGFNKWKSTWEAWLEAKQVTQPPVLTPLVTMGNNRRHTMSFSPVQQMYSPHHTQNMMQPQAVHNGFVGDRMRQQNKMSLNNHPMSSNEFWWPSAVPSGDYSPPSAPETGPATPEWNLGMNWASHCGVQAMHPASRPVQQGYQGRPLSHHQQQHYLTPPQHNHVWGPHCNCLNCGGGYNMLGQNNFFMNQGQPVIG